MRGNRPELLALTQMNQLAPFAVDGKVADNDVQPVHIYGSNVQLARIFAAAPIDASAIAVETETEQLGLAAWEMRASEAYDNVKAERPREGEPWDQGELIEPDGPGMRHGEPGDDVKGFELAPAPETSAFLIGSVAVGLVLVEGPTADLKFSAAERTKVVAEVQEGLTWLATGDPRANVSFAYDIQIVDAGVAPDATLADDYEPLEGHWRNPAMAKLGFAASFAGVQQYVASIRAKLATRWAYVAYFTKYPVHHFAYASKPRLVMHYENDGWGPDNIDRVFAHETGHIFGCPDEYRSSACNCSSRFGFLREPNGNCERCANPFTECLMAANTWAMCEFTKVHLGWRDKDGDGKLDPDD